MRALRMISLMLLLVMVFVSMDLGINCIGALIPEFQDGIPYNSFLQSAFGLLEDWNIRTRPDFFYAFQRALLITFVLLAENVILAVWKKKD